MKLNHLLQISKKLRQDTFLAFIKKGEAHLGGSFSLIEILVTLYAKILRTKDKFILSKSHASYPLCILLTSRCLTPTSTLPQQIEPQHGNNCICCIRK